MKTPTLILILVLAYLLCITNASAQWLWARTATGLTGSSSQVSGADIAIDAAGNCFAAGTFTSDSITFGNTTIQNAASSTADVYLTKYDASGNVVWVKLGAGTGYDAASQVTTDPFGNIILTGIYSDSMPFDGVTLDPYGANTGYVVKFSGAGNVLWAKAIGVAAGAASGVSVASDLSGNVYVTGTFYGDSIVFDDTTLFNSHPTSYDVYLVKFDPDGNVIRAKLISGVNGNDLATDASGNVFVTGEYGAGPAVFDSITLSGVTSPPDVYIAKYDSTGHVLWAKGMYGSGADYCRSIETNANGNVYMAGYYNGLIYFDAIHFSQNGGPNIFIAAISPSGSVNWAQQAGGALDDYCQSMTVDQAGNIGMTGSTTSSGLNFGTFTYYTTGFSQLLTAKYSSSGNALWAYSAVDPQEDHFFGKGIVSDTAGNFYITGYFDNSLVSFGNDTLLNPVSRNMFIAALSWKISVPEESRPGQLTISPNPTTGELRVSANEFSIESFDVYDVFGKKILSSGSSTSARNEISVDVNKLTPGIYLLNAKGKSRNIYGKFVKE